ncbi:MAG: hypothetical protein Sapg2KO_32200 [Saprospiraceae bacterium]
MTIRNCLFLCLLFLKLSCSEDLVVPIIEVPPPKIEEEKSEVEADYHLLFVGNSLTYYNDLPRLVKDEAAKRDIEIATKTLAKGNYAIVDHWDDGSVQSLIRSKKYDFVIIQQGPSSQDEGFNILVESGADYAELCKANDTKLAYFMVWPSRNYYHTFDGVIKNYTTAATVNNAILCPVGKVWKKHFNETNDFSYYGLDGFHPSLKGSEVAANVIVNTLFP